MAKNTILSKYQKRFFEFLKEKEVQREEFTLADVSAATGWNECTPGDYIRKGYWTLDLVCDESGNYKVSGVTGLSERQFHKRITQTQKGRSFAPWLDHELSRALAKRSRDNMVLALELYNRPSLENRLDGFTVLFAIAWEQLLKVEILETENDEQAIFRKPTGKARETISLGECISKVTSLPTPVKRNLETLKELRDKSVHLLMPELQNPLGFLFQAGVINFENHFAAVTGESFLPQQSAGLLSLVSESVSSLSFQALTVKYGKRSAEEILNLSDRLKERIEEEGDRRFSIPLDYRTVLTNKPGKADITVGITSTDDLSAVILHRAKDPDQSHPFTRDLAVSQVDKLLRERLSRVDFRAIVGPKEKFSSHDFEAVVAKKKWKRNRNSEYHYHSEVTGRRRYSKYAIDAIVDLLCRERDYLANALISLSEERKRNRAKKS